MQSAGLTGWLRGLSGPRNPALPRHHCSKRLTARTSNTMRYVVVLSAVLVLTAATFQASTVFHSSQPATGYRLVFNEEFDKLDLSPDGLGIHQWYEKVW